MREAVCNFGPNDRLFGILTTPDQDVRVAGAPTAVILNAGIVHRVGPFRLHVDIARNLAQQGYSTLRIDLSGLGDSAARTGKVTADDRATMDVADALNHLEEKIGSDRFVLIGLCSGAYNAHQAAIKDDRVVGAVFLDGIVFRTAGYYLRHHVGRLLRGRFWRNAIKRRFSGWSSIGSLGSYGSINAEDVGNKLGESEFFENPNSRHEVIRELKAMIERKMQMLFVYTGGYDDFCGRGQFREMFGVRPDDEQLQVEYYRDAEHTFRLTENRKVVCSRITDWFIDRFGKHAKDLSPQKAAQSNSLA